MYPAEDSFLRLTPQQQVVDRAIRESLPNGDQMRGCALYVWEDRKWAIRAWKLRRSPFLYTLEFDEADIIFRSDLNHYTDATDAVGDGIEFDKAIARYCTNAPLLAHHIRPRVELLIGSARVMSVEKL